VIDPARNGDALENILIYVKSKYVFYRVTVARILIFYAQTYFCAE